MRYELWLGLRYLFAKRRERFISVIALLSIGGVALGVWALLVVLAVMSGFDFDIKDKLVGTNAHIIVDSPEGIKDSDALMRQLASIEHVNGVSPFVSGQAMLRLPERPYGVIVRGIDPQRETRVSRLASYIVMGHLPKQDDEIVIGTELSSMLHARIGDRLNIISPIDMTSSGLVISGIFHSGHYEADALLVGMTISRSQKMYRLGSVVSGIGIKLDQLERSFEMKGVIQRRIGAAYTVRTWMDLNQTFFDALKLEKMTMFVILTLIVLVVAANIVSTLIMMVTEKTRDIGILKSIGATDGSIRLLFICEGLLIGSAGIAFGAAVAYLTIWALDTYQFIKLPSTVYYLDHLPVRIEWGDWLKTVSAAMGITLLSTLYPARQAARLSPVEALRYE